MSVAHQIAELETRRVDRLDAAEGLHERATLEARDLNAFEKTAFESLTSEIEDIDAELAGLRREEMLSAGRAKSVLLPGQPTSQNPTARGIGAVKSNAPKGSILTAPSCRSLADGAPANTARQCGRRFSH